MLRRYVPASWSPRPITEITRQEIRAHLDNLAARTPGTGESRFRTAANGLELRRRSRAIAASPWAQIDRPTAERSRDRVLTVDEIRAVWAALRMESSQTQALFHLYFLTAQRGGELRTMQWRDVDLHAGWWVIPAERSKNKRAHRVPLSPWALAVFRDLGRTAGDTSWVFPATAGSGHRMNVQAAQNTLRANSGVTDFTPHDIRRRADQTRSRGSFSDRPCRDDRAAHGVHLKQLVRIGTGYEEATRFRVKSMPVGIPPTANVDSTRNPTASMLEIVPSPELVTNKRLVASLNAKSIGPTPTGTAPKNEIPLRNAPPGCSLPQMFETRGGSTP
jgi:hypothetical protein